MILVVAMHVYQLLYVQWFDIGAVTNAWDALVSATQPFRMPLFFLISGYLATRAVTRPWSDVARPRVWSILYLYGVWLAIYIVVRTLRVGVEGEAVPWGDYALEFLWPASSLWYLYALVLYFVVVKLTRFAPWWTVVGVGAVISIVGTTLFEDGTVQYVLRCFVFFALGARLPHLLDVVTSKATWRRFVIAFVLYGLAAAVTLWVGKQTPGLITVAGVVGIVAMLWFSKLIAAGAVSRPLRYIGRNTLAIFVLHPILISLAFTALLVTPGIAEALRSSVIVVAVMPAFLIAGVTALSLGIEALCKRIGLGFLFKLPGGAKTATVVSDSR